MIRVEEAKLLLEDVLDYEIGNVAFIGDDVTVRDFIEYFEWYIGGEFKDIDELNHALIECGIKPILVK